MDSLPTEVLTAIKANLTVADDMRLCLTSQKQYRLGPHPDVAVPFLRLLATQPHLTLKGWRIRPASPASESSDSSASRDSSSGRSAQTTDFLAYLRLCDACFGLPGDLRQVLALVALEAASGAAAQPFAVGGRVPLARSHEPLLAVRTRGAADDAADAAAVLHLRDSPPARWAAVLSAAADPAAFGRGGATVLDAEYRVALKLDADAFVCNLGQAVADIVAESVEPALRTDSRNSGKRVVPELYKMNVYCPGGFFKPHCDTPRATSMFGSLVVCLPLEHAGGDLVVRHKGKTVVFDWGNRIQQDLQQQQQQKNAETGGELAPPSIHWAAFFSDCEHEILPVQSGLRVTITYNLHLVETKVDDVICPPVDSNSLGPFHTLLAESLKDPSFMPKGGTLGFGLQHQYPMGLNVPERIFSLKGNDLLVHKSATDLGIGVRIMAAYNVDDDEDSEDDLENDPDNDSDDEDGNNEADNDIAKKKPSKTSPTVDAFKQYRPSFNRYISGILISDCFSGGGGDYEERSTKSILKDEVDAIHDKSIKWVHYPSHEELASTYMTYGNEASVAYIYVSGCMLLDIPSLADRKDSR